MLPGPLLPRTHTYIQPLCQAEDRGQGREALKGPGPRVCHDLEYHGARNSWTAQQPRLSAWQLLPSDLPRLCPPWATCVDWPLVHQAGLKPLSSADHNVGLRFFARVCRLYRNFSLLGLLGREEREDYPGNSRAPPPPRSCPVPCATILALHSLAQLGAKCPVASSPQGFCWDWTLTLGHRLLARTVRRESRACQVQHPHVGWLMPRVS